MNTIGKRGLCGLLATVALAGMVPAAAQQNFPSRPIRILSAQSPSGGIDAMTRGIADALGTALNQAVVLEARPGAGGMIAGEACARAPADGYTLCMVDSFATMLNPHLYANMSYDPVKDFVPITLLGFVPSGIWVHKDVPAQSMTELFDLARAKPGQINMASWGRASSPYIYVEYLKHKGIVFTDIPYKSSGDAWRAVLSGEVQFTNYNIKVGAAQGQGRTRLLAVNTDQRLPDFPDVPTFAEVGLPVVQTWFALFAPKGTPSDVVNRIQSEIARSVYRHPDVVERVITAPGFVATGPSGASPDEIARFLQSQSQMYASYVKAAQVQKQ